MEYPIAELFYSVQGEGSNSGIPMVFVRLAGCNVGKPYSRVEREYHPELRIYQNECTIYDGRKFPCDTNYGMSRKMSPEAIREEIKTLSPNCVWVSITGGEPLIHDLEPLIECLKDAHYHLHLETSGTVRLDSAVVHNWGILYQFDWVVVSPKHPFLDEYAEFADEIRILVDKDFEFGSLPKSVQVCKEKLWISPVNHAGTINKDNADLCVHVLSQHPEVRVSLQIHKVLNVR